MNIQLNSIKKKLIIIAMLLLFVFVFSFTGQAYATTDEHTGDDFYDNPASVSVISNSDTGKNIFDYLNFINPFTNFSLEDGYYRIKSSANKNFCVDVAGASFARGTNIQLYSSNGTDAQLWKVINCDDGYILIVNVNSGLVLDITGANAQNGTNVQSYFTNHTDAQLWKPTKSGDNVVLLSKLDNNFALDISCGIICNESNIQIYEANGTAAQSWCFDKADAPKLEIPAFNLSLNATTLDEINSGSKDTKYPNNKLELVEEDKTTICEEVEIKGRGNSTWQAEKKPYNIKLATKTDLLGLGKAKKWALLANYYDPSNIRNDTAFYTAQLMSQNNTWGGEFVNLYVDNEYVGLYWLTHRVEINSNAVDIGSEGIICEMDGWPPDDIYFNSAIAHSQISLKDTSVESSKAQYALDRFEITYNNFEKALYDKNWESINNFIDVDSFAYMILLTDFVYNGDAFGNSQFFYKDTFDGKIYCGPPWDYDASFFKYPFAINDPYRTICFHNGYKRVDGLLMEIPEFRKLVENKYNTILKQNKSNILNYVQSRSASINDSALKNNSKWHFTNIVNGVDYSNFKDDVNYVVTSTQKHFDFLDMLYGNSVDVNEGLYNIRDKSGAQLSNIYVQRQSDGFYKLIDFETGNGICVLDASLENDARCGYQELGNHDMYKWKFSKIGNDYYIVSKRTGLVLDTFNGLHQYDMLGSNTQIFNLSPTTMPVMDIEDGSTLQINSMSNSYTGISSSSGNNVELGYGQNINSTIFKFIKNSDNTYSLEDTSKGLVVDVTGNGSSNGTNIQLYKSNGSVAQKWILKKNSDNSCTFINPYSWKTLDVWCGLSSVGTNIQLYQMNNTLAQKWNFNKDIKNDIYALAKANKNTLTEGTYKITSGKDSNYSLDVSCGSKDDCANIQLYSSNNTDAQKWWILVDKDGFVNITNVGSRKALDVNAGNAADCTNIWQYSNNNSFAQKWIAVKDGQNIKLVSALNPNKVLDLSGGVVSNCSNIQLYSDNSTAAQRWRLQKL